MTTTETTNVVENETVTTETTNTVERAEAVTDDVIIAAYLEAAKAGGTMQDAADLAGMKRGSYNGRIGALKKLLGADTFPKLAQAPKTGKTRKKDPAAILALFNKINSEIGKADKTETETPAS